ncbi:hypothetical protein BW731_01430 [Vagococcus martis]|uniref:DUF58 domain-containing protein n=1 Tax=Vagococcus martis TaxID=1768210 RepID=A0A1V4DEN1_9ENTE|nr:DUF58 domain-containing protein [Vagococcus martis]OPF86955.1 hypothetical protein BW731_01430 [Vagococcus martis]
MSYKVKNRLHFISYTVLFLVVLFYTLTFLTTIGWILIVFMSMTLIVSFIGIKLADVEKISVKLDNYLLTSKKETITTEVTIQKNMSGVVFFPVLKISISELGFTKYIYGYTGKRETIQIEWQANQRGHYEEIQVELVSRDLFYLFLKDYKQNVTVDWNILPQTFTNTQGLMRLFQFVFRKQALGEASYDIKGYRTYTHGDSMKQVDWKVSSKQQEIMVKEFSYEKEELPIFVFYGQTSFYFEAMLDVFYNVYNQFEHSPTSFYLLGEGVDEEKIDDVMSFATIRKKETIELARFLREKNKSAIVFVPELTERIKQEISDCDSSLTIQTITYQDIKEGGDIA